ncbi:MAG TPA: dihydrofolate reductase [Steroidobacteraceae bacterium]
MPRVTLIVATDERGAIGRDGQLPWRLPEDLRRFKALTLGKPVVMGRRTWDSIGRPLPGRHNIVVTRQAGLALPGATVAGSLAEALAAAGDVPEVCVIGGAEIYRLALPLADTVHLTRVHATVAADTFFPPLEPWQWEQVACEDRAADERHAHAYSFVELRRRA